ncbi:MAG TPA: peptidyl-prolyl cis-trans isomerase [Candidatus Mediterraneibacter stercoripullorum]|nr:peptidyl-prolyl cis-trans isomerase [Candidatus Mediterraneibacter stercoripullorum]
MVRFGKKAAVVTAAGVLAAMSATGCSSSLNPDAVVATVGDEDISLGVANFYTRMTQGEYETYYASMMGTTAEDMWTQEVDEQGTTMEEQLKDNIMQSLQNMYLMSQHASDYDIALTDEEEQAISDAADQFVADNTEEVRNTVSGNKEDVQKVLELVTIQSRMTEAMQEGVDEEVSDEEAAQKSMDYVLFSYTTTDDSGNSTEMTDEEKENLAATAQEFANQVKNGTDMTDAAEADGVEVQTATFDSESTTPDADLIAAADALENEGDVTDPVETDSGIYVARLTSLLDRDATDTEKETIVEQRRQDQYNSLLEEWRDAAEIDVNERNWNKIDFTYQGITIVTPEEETSEETSTDNTDDSGSAEGSGTSEDSGTDGAE